MICLREKLVTTERDIPAAFSAEHTSSEDDGVLVPTENDIYTQVQRILASRFFSGSDRLRRFVSFAANHALTGDGQRLKEHMVGVEVFDRRPNYDPRIDPIVRVEARRLRSKLKSYYASVGRDDQLLIEFPKGSYTPIFRFRTPVRNKSRPAIGSAVAVLPFVNLTDSARDECVSDGLTEELIHQLIQIPSLQVVVCQPASQPHGHCQSLTCRSDATKWNLRGSIRYEHGNIRVIVQLIDTTSGAYVWSETYDRAIADIFASQEEIAQAVVAKLEFTLDLPQSTKAS